MAKKKITLSHDDVHNALHAMLVAYNALTYDSTAQKQLLDAMLSLASSDETFAFFRNAIAFLGWVEAEAAASEAEGAV